MKELLLRIRAMFEGKPQTQEAEKAVEAVADKAKEVGVQAEAATPKVEALLDTTKAKAEKTTEALKETAAAAKEVGAEGGGSGKITFDELFPGAKDDLTNRVDKLSGDSSAGEDFLKGAKNKAADVETAMAGLETLVLRFTAIVTAAKIGWEAGNYVQDKIFNWASTMAAGGLSSEEDMRRATSLTNESGSRLTGFNERAGNMTTSQDRSSLMADVEAYQRELINAKSKLGINETQQRTELDRTIAQLQDFWEQALAINPEMVAQMRQAKAEAEAEAIARFQADIERALNSDAYASGQTRLEGQRRFNQLSPDDQLKDLKAKQEAVDTIAGNRFGNVDPEQQKAAVAESLKLLEQIDKLESKITQEKEKQAAKDAEKAAIAEKLSTELDNQLKIDGERAKGNETVARRMEFILALEKELDGLRAKGVTNEEKLTEYAQQKTAIFEQSLNAKREELALETQINEAKAAGNVEEEKKLQWLKEVNTLKRQGLADDEAARSVNAKLAAQDPRTKPAGTDPTRPDPQSPFGPSGLDSVVDVTKPAQPRGIGPEIAPKGSEGFGTDGSDAKPGGPEGGDKAGKGGAGAAAKELAEIKKSYDELVKLFREMLKATQEVVKKIEAQKAPEEIGKIGDATTAADEKLSKQIQDVADRIT